VADLTPAQAPDRAPATVSVPAGRLVTDQLVYAVRDVSRNPVMTVVTVAFPLLFLFMLGIASQDAPVDPVTGTAVIQTTAPIAAVFAAVMAAYVLLPFQVSNAREQGILKRLHGSPLPLWTYVTGRVGMAAGVAIVGTTLMMAVAVIAFDLTFPWPRLPVIAGVFLAGVGCFAALGFAAAVILRGAETVLTFTMGSFLLTAFASGTFAPDLALPRPLDIGTWFLPLRHFSTAFGEQFVPAAAGTGLPWEHLAVLLAWGAAGAGIGLWRLSWEPSGGRATVGGRNGVARRWAESRRRQDASGNGAGRRPGFATLVWGQYHQANRQVWRQPSAVFFAVAFPLTFVIVVPYAFGQPVLDGVPLARIVVPSMAVFGAVITAFVNLPENVAIARDKGILKRLRGTPLPAAAYVSGRIGSAVYLGLLAVTGAFVAGRVVHDVEVPLSSVPALLVVFLVGIPSLAALGMTIVALTPDANAVPAVGLAIFMPMAFMSEILAFGMELPEVLQTIAWMFPFKHLVYATEVAFATGEVAVGYLAVVLGWGLAGAVVAVWRFRWDPN
jgi:ABC-2 type transport system permease protein